MIRDVASRLSFAVPASRRLIVEIDTPACSAKVSCDQPSRWRLALITFEEMTGDALPETRACCGLVSEDSVIKKCSQIHCQSESFDP